MENNNEDWIINNLIQEDLHSNFHNLYGKNIYLSDNDIKVLERYDFDINNYSDIKNLMFDIEEYIDDNTYSDLDDLESVLDNLSEFDYYHNTDK